MIVVSDDPGFKTEVQTPTETPTSMGTEGAVPKKRGGGPKTTAGREVSKRNALRFGLFAESIFPPDLALEIERYTDVFRTEFAPRSEYEHLLVKRLGTIQAKRDECEMRQLIDAQRCFDLASPELWDEQRRDRAADLGSRLPKDPGRVARVLGQTKQGTDWIIEKWWALGEIARNQGSWDEGQRQHALDLLGVIPVLRSGNPVVPAGDDRPALEALVASQVETHERRQEAFLEAADESDRLLAEKGIWNEDDKTTRGLRRSESACKRDWNRTLAELLRVQAGKAPAMGPAAPAPPPRTPSPAPSQSPEISRASLERLKQELGLYPTASAEAPTQKDAAATEVRSRPESAPASTAAAAPVVAEVPVAEVPVAAAVPIAAASPKVARLGSLAPAPPQPRNRRERKAMEKKAREAESRRRANANSLE